MKAEEAMAYLKINRKKLYFLLRKCPMLKGGTGKGNGLDFSQSIHLFKDYLDTKKAFENARLQLMGGFTLKNKQSKYSI